MDFLLINRDRIVVLSFMTSSSNISAMPTPLPMITSPSPIHAINATSKPPPALSRNAQNLTPTKKLNVTKFFARYTTTSSTTTIKTPSINETEKKFNNSGLPPKSLPFSMEKTLIDIFGIEPWDSTAGDNSYTIEIQRKCYYILIVIFFNFIFSTEFLARSCFFGVFKLRSSFVSVCRALPGCLLEH